MKTLKNIVAIVRKFDDELRPANQELLRTLLESQGAAYQETTNILVSQFNTRTQSLESQVSELCRSLQYSQKEIDDLKAEIEASQKECRNYNSELFRLRVALQETMEQLDVVKRENKNLADEIKDLLDQLGDGGRSIHELDKQKLPDYSSSLWLPPH